jgi:hemerythrin-like domain-containing protein
MDAPRNLSRRAFFKVSAATGGALLFAGCAGTAGRIGGLADASSGGAGDEVTPAEDLMREHGLLRRILLVYGEVVRRADAGEGVAAQPVADAAGIIRSFVEDYHEKLEEDFLFPRFRKAGKHVDLVDVLTEQHRAGRRLTESVSKLATPESVKDPANRRAVAGSLRAFIRMYNPHAAREDTVLFPALRQIMTARQYDALGDQFEDKEHDLFGKDGFETMVDRVAGIEKVLGLYDLKEFTPGVNPA